MYTWSEIVTLEQVEVPVKSIQECPAASVAQALVQVVSGQVPVCLLIVVTSGYKSTVDEKKLKLQTSFANEVEMSLSLVEREKFLSLILSYADVFVSSTSDLGWANKMKHSTDTGGAVPI